MYRYVIGILAAALILGLAINAGYADAAISSLLTTAERDLSALSDSQLSQLFDDAIQLRRQIVREKVDRGLTSGELWEGHHRMTGDEMHPECPFYQEAESDLGSDSGMSRRDRRCH